MLRRCPSLDAAAERAVGQAAGEAADRAVAHRVARRLAQPPEELRRQEHRVGSVVPVAAADVRN